MSTPRRIVWIRPSAGDEQAWFHAWTLESQGSPAFHQPRTVAIIETKDGRVELVEPSWIRFLFEPRVDA